MATTTLFSKRNQPAPAVLLYDELPAKFRQQVNFLLVDTIGNLHWQIDASEFYGDDALSQAAESAFAYIRDTICREHGLNQLVPRRPDTATAEIAVFIRSSDEVFYILDLIELSMRLLEGYADDSVYQYRGESFVDAVDILNTRFRENGIGYVYDAESKRLQKVGNPLTHDNIISPALALLTGAGYENANLEYLAALQDYKYARYGEAITKAGSAYESVMKVICDKRNWTHDAGKPAGHLVKVIVVNSNLEGVYEQILMAPANVRNHVSTAHGGGTNPRNAEERHCLLTLNYAASAILYLIEEFG